MLLAGACRNNRLSQASDALPNVKKKASSFTHYFPEALNLTCLIARRM